MQRCYRVEPDAVVVSLRLTPKAARDGIDGVGVLSDGRPVVLARVRAVPADGAANAALVSLLAKTLKVRKSAIAVTAGHTSRLKQVRIAGDPASLEKAIAAWPVVA